MHHPILPFVLAAVAAIAIWVQHRIVEAFARARGLSRELRFWRPVYALPMDVGGVHVDLSVQQALPPLTRVSAPLAGVAPAFVLEIQRRGALLGATEALLHEANTGNRTFDAAFVLRSSDVDVARSIVDRRLAHLMGTFPCRAFALRVDRNECSVSWPGTEQDDTVIDRAVELVFTACRRKA